MSSSWSVEVESLASAVPLFNAGFADWNNLGPKLLPEVIKSITILSGDGNSGTIRQVDLSPASPFSFVKERIDFINNEKLEQKITVLEGGNLGKKLESTINHFKVVPKGNGSVAIMEETYQVIPGADVSEDFQKLKEVFTLSVKVVEEYLLANPNAYA